MPRYAILKGIPFLWGVAMPNFISAYKLQQRDGLTRQRVIELAEIGPVYWVAQGEELFQSNVKHGYFPDGFKRLQGAGIKHWTGLVNASEKINATWENMENTPFDEWKNTWKDIAKQLKEWFNPLRVPEEKLPYDSLIDPWESGPDSGEDDDTVMPNTEKPLQNYEGFWATNLRHCLGDILSLEISGKTASGLFKWKLPEEFSQQPEKIFNIDDVLNKMNFHQLLHLSKTSTQAKLDENIWTYLQYEPSPLLDLIFERIFIEWLAFDADNLPRRSPDRPDSNNEIATAIENHLDSTLTLKITERRYCVALIARLRGETNAEAYLRAFHSTVIRDPKELDKQGREYCKRAIKVVKDKMDIIVDPNCIRGKV